MGDRGVCPNAHIGQMAHLPFGHRASQNDGNMAYLRQGNRAFTIIYYIGAKRRFFFKVWGVNIKVKSKNKKRK